MQATKIRKQYEKTKVFNMHTARAFNSERTILITWWETRVKLFWLWIYRSVASENIVDVSLFGFCEIDIIYILFVHHSWYEWALWENAHSGGILLSICGILGREQIFSFLWVVLAECMEIYFCILRVSLYVLLTIIRPGISDVLIERRLVWMGTEQELVLAKCVGRDTW